ncbi:MAG: YcxB family protein [Terracidiphilus sp.]|jgi:hypothetical protein
MKLTYTLTINDYKAAQRLHLRQRLGRRLAFTFWYVAVPILAAAGALAFALLDVSKLTHFAAIYFGIEAALVWLSIYLPLMRFYTMRKCFKQMFPPSRTDRTSSIDIDDERAVSTIPGVSEGKFFWSAIIDFAQDDKVTLLYIRKKAFLFFPTSALSTDERAELNALVACNVKRES